MTRPIKLQNSGTSGNFRRLVPSVGFPFDVPRRLRAFVRARETSLVLLAVVIGALGGLAVAAMSALVDLLHMVLFGLGPGERLSAQAHLDPSVAIRPDARRTRPGTCRYPDCASPAGARSRPDRSQ